MKIHHFDKHGKDVWCLVVLNGNGIVSVSKEEGEFQIYDLNVVPVKRGEGLGKTLIKEAENLILKEGGSDIYIEVKKDPLLIEWFEKLGYSIIDKYPDHVEMMKIVKES